MTTPDGPICDHCKQPLPENACIALFFFCQFRYCSTACADAAEEERLRQIRAEQFSIERHGRRNWKVVDGNGELVCVTVYKKGAAEVIHRLYRRRPPPFHPCTGTAIQSAKPLSRKRPGRTLVGLYDKR